jgi:lipopolysaccharide transport protein LptA
MRSFCHKYKSAFWGLLLLPLMHLSASAERLPDFSPDETVFIRADKAWEDPEPDIVHFSGDFELKAHDWHLYADRATLYGNLEDPETVLLEGSPARVWVTVTSGDKQAIVEGEASSIEYRRALNTVRMTGDAMLVKADNIMRSNEIEYDIEADRFSAGGDQGVQFSVTPKE